jgi:hypothetical protein
MINQQPKIYKLIIKKGKHTFNIKVFFFAFNLGDYLANCLRKLKMICSRARSAKQLGHFQARRAWVVVSPTGKPVTKIKIY